MADVTPETTKEPQSTFCKVRAKTSARPSHSRACLAHGIASIDPALRSAALLARVRGLPSGGLQVPQFVLGHVLRLLVHHVLLLSSSNRRRADSVI